MANSDKHSLDAERNQTMTKFNNEYRKISNGFSKRLDSASRMDNIITGLAGGALVGILLSFMLSQTFARTPTHKRANRTTEYKFDKNKMAGYMPKTLVITILLSLLIVATKTIADHHRNSNLADILTDDIIKRYFDKPLRNYRMSTDKTYYNTVRAATLIINNMPESDLSQLRILAYAGLVPTKDGHYTFREDVINTAAARISAFINTTPELSYNILRIMRGEEPTTYFLTNLNHQKTR